MPDIFGRKSALELGWDLNLNKVDPSSLYSPNPNTPGLSTESVLQDAVPANIVLSGDFSQPLFNGKRSPTDSAVGFWQGLDPTDKTYKWIIGGTSSSIDWNVTTADTLTIVGSINATTGMIGGFTIGSTTISAPRLVLTSGAANVANIAVGFGSSSAGINSASAGSDIAFWAGSTFAGRATAPFRVNANGDLTATSVSITGLTHSNTYTSNDTWTKPTGVNFVFVIAVGAGGGGGGGFSGAASSGFGGSGGGGGTVATKLFNASDLGATVSISIGSGGSGGPAASAGSAGGNSSFGSSLIAYGGGGGYFGAGAATNSSGGGGGGTGGIGTVGSPSGPVLGGLPANTAGANGISGQGGGGTDNAITNNAEYGGGGGGGTTSAAGVPRAGGSSLFGGAGGGAGGSTSVNGADGGASGSYTSGGGGAHGSNNATSPTAGVAGTNGDSTVCGFGGGGGGGCGTVGTGAVGGAGGSRGGGGGGGGASFNGTGGAGGNGGAGEIRVFSW